MTYKLLQLNIDMGNQLDKLITHIKNNDYDILHLQELGGKERTQNKIDTFSYLQKELTNYEGHLLKMFRVIDKPNNYMGPATFVRKGIEIIGYEEVWMTDFWEITEDNDNPVDRPYAVLVTKIKTINEELLLVNGQFTWGPRPFDTDITIERSKKVYDYLKSAKRNFILTGDFNVDSRTITVMQFEDLGKNLTRDHKITNTLNPRLHRAKHLFPQGIPCDQVIVSSDIIVKNFLLVEEDLSDHFGLALQFTL
jgi:endonuclease/exonuclease/phosphatase family metal-dependent hydrolase